MNKLALIILLISLKYVSLAQNVIIKGHAKTFENKELGLWIYNDYISNTEKQLSFSTIDSAGNFILELNSTKIQYVTLKIENQIAAMHIEPFASYEILLSPADSTSYQNQNLEQDIKISIKLKSKIEINALTMDYDKHFDDFLSVDYRSFVSRSAQTKIDSFKIAMKSYYATVQNNYFEAYLTYTIAALEEKTQVSKKKLFESYLENKPILYYHPEYNNFFNTFYKQKLQSISLTKQSSGIVHQINDRQNLKETLLLMKIDPYLQNDTICELVLIKGLYESYYDGTFNRGSIIAMLDHIIMESNIAENRDIAQNILNSFSKLNVGAAAPIFELPDIKGYLHSLNKLRTKKYVYLMFFDISCSACMQQMKVLPSLKKQYGTQIEFVSVSLDLSKGDFKNFCINNPKFDWLFLHDNVAAQMRKKYEIKSLPAYFLINPLGNFMQVPAESPVGDIDRIFYDITKPKWKKHNIGSKKNN